MLLRGMTLTSRQCYVLGYANSEEGCIGGRALLP